MFKVQDSRSGIPSRQRHTRRSERKPKGRRAADQFGFCSNGRSDRKYRQTVITMYKNRQETVAIADPNLAPFLQAAIGTRYRLVQLGTAPNPGLYLARAVIVDGSRPFDKSVCDAMPNLGLIACFNTGYDGVDVNWARGHGIIVTHARNVNHEDVADFTIGQILNIFRKISIGSRWIQDGEWQSGKRLMTTSISGLHLGIVGLGSIGQALARRADVMRMVTSWWAPHDNPYVSWPKASDLIELSGWSDVLVVAANATEANRGLISGRIINALGPRGVLINVARGSLVDEDAVVEALRQGALGAAALDVFQEEPVSLGRWGNVPNMYLSPHIAGVTDLALSSMAALVVANLDAFFLGKPVLTAAA
ncbi:lactate dehydrogenase-like 2-hydroxyacid dehydrogenase [Rhizobium sp. BK313]|uniref:NAD(P)-dependent oxidoreductase n=1 Tax=Rhizobium sp. BK313 TaxID=2587081 RepID=UPI001060160D|nr:NAD(P)-dependent oxidoreductase [Rhizobium sp. BK313]MBB3452776.1 lactate dehydrogenase-like 2-hydroxyacid dehydrogenase [Rhizobium sp. BK313]